MMVSRNSEEALDVNTESTNQLLSFLPRSLQLEGEYFDQLQSPGLDSREFGTCKYQALMRVTTMATATSQSLKFAAKTAHNMCSTPLP